MLLVKSTTTSYLKFLGIIIFLTIYNSSRVSTLLFKNLSLQTFSKTIYHCGSWSTPGGLPKPFNFQPLPYTFIQYISNQIFKQFGFTSNSVYPVHWFQFADDAAVITGLENENQILLNHFTRWCAWADIQIRVDKCSTFGIKKSSTSSTQYLPNLIINHEVVSTIDIGKSFRYLGRHFNCAMDNQIHMFEVLDLLKDLMNRIGSLSCHPKNKLLIYHQCLLSKLSWHLTDADLSKTWVVQNIDNIVTKYVRQWLDLPISATLSTLVLQKSKYGINLILPSTKNILTVRRSLGMLSKPLLLLKSMLCGQRPAMAPISNMINTVI